MLARSQTAILTVLAHDEKLRRERGEAWVGRTTGSLVGAVSRLMGESSAYAAIAALVKVGFIDERYRAGRGTGGVKHFLWITPDGLRALEHEHVLIEEAVSTAVDDGATMGSATEGA